ncbi:MAG: hypothetical protein ACI4R5_07745 [Acetatifactor sp.]
MSSMIETAEKEVMRNEILKMCQEAAPQGASVQVVRAGLKKLGIMATDSEVEKQFNYLYGKGLLNIQRIDNERLGINRLIAAITASGIDCLEGNGAVIGVSGS